MSAPTIQDWNERLKRDGWRSAGEPRMCPRCQEDRIVTVTTIAGKTSGYCGVCSFSWAIVE